MPSLSLPTPVASLASVQGPQQGLTGPPEISFPAQRYNERKDGVDVAVGAVDSQAIAAASEKESAIKRRKSVFVLSDVDSPEGSPEASPGGYKAGEDGNSEGMYSALMDIADALKQAAQMVDEAGNPLDLVTLQRAKAKQDNKRVEQERTISEAFASGPLAPLLARAEAPGAGPVEEYNLGSAIIKGVGMKGKVSAGRRAELAFPYLLNAAEGGYALAQYYVGLCFAHGDGVARNVVKAVSYFKQAAERGDPDAQWRLGHCLLSGEGVEAVDILAAAAWFRKGAKLGHAKCCYDFGVCLLTGEGVACDEKAAIEWLLKAAEQGYAEAQSDLAQCLFEGTGCDSDEVAAVNWWRKAAEKGVADAIFHLGECARTGSGGVTRDEVEAAQFYSRAVELGHARAMFRLGVALNHGLGISRDTSRGFQLLLKAAEMNVMLAQIEVAHAYQNGVFGVKRDLQKAVEWYRYGAAHGHSEACYQLGVLYSRGIPGYLDKDTRAGLSWVLKAASVGHVEACFHAGVCFEVGEGCDCNFNEAALWYRKAADRRHTLACNALGSCYLEAKGLPRDTSLAAAWFGLAAAKGVAEAQYRLGTFCDSGDGADLDKVAAARWYHRAAEQSYPAAMHKLGQAFERGVGVVKDPALACAWYKKATILRYFPAFLSLSLCYERGVGVARDCVQAYALLKLMGECGDKGIFLDAWVGCGRLLLRGEGGLERNVPLGLKYYQRAASGGHAAAQCQIGCWYLDGEMVAHGVEKRISKAAYWLQLAADQDQPDAIANLGLCYARDEQPMWEKNIAKAISCFRRAGEMGVPLAQCCLGVYYKNGDGVPKDSAKAFALYKLAAEQGNKEAEYNLSKCYYYGDGTERDRGAAAVLERRAALQGHPEAQFRVGYRYFKGDAVDMDRKTAFKWYSLSSEQGFGLAQYNLALCFLMGEGTQYDEKQARFWMRKAEQNGLQQAEEALRTNFASLGQEPQQLSGRAPSPPAERGKYGKGRGVAAPPSLDDFPVVGLAPKEVAVGIVRSLSPSLQ
jgi:uncharacterized protein